MVEIPIRWRGVHGDMDMYLCIVGLFFLVNGILNVFIPKQYRDFSLGLARKYKFLFFLREFDLSTMRFSTSSRRGDMNEQTIYLLLRIVGIGHMILGGFVAAAALQQILN